MISNYGTIEAAKPCCRGAVRARYTPKSGKPDRAGRCDCEHHRQEPVRIPRKYRGKPKITLIKAKSSR